MAYLQLIERKRYANKYDTGVRDARGRRVLRSVLGGIPNIPVDRNGNLAPLDNTLDVSTDHPIVRYLVRRGPFEIGFHNRNTNRYLSAVRLRTGEQMSVTLEGDVPVTPTVVDPRTLRWDYGAAGWFEHYATERMVKKRFLQKAGRTVAFRYKSTGLTPSLNVDRTEAILTRSNGQRAFTVRRPYYMDADGAFVEWAPVAWSVDNGDYVVTLAAPDTDRLVDPIIEFGEGAGMTGGDHKDSYILEGNTDKAFANLSFLITGGTSANYAHILMRYSLTGHIPAGATVNAATLHAVLKASPASDLIVACHKLTTDWGVTATDEGATEEPAASGQGTWRRPKDYNGAGGDADWAIPGAISASDYGSSEDTETIASTDSLGTEYTWDIPIMTQSWVSDDASNYGCVLIGDSNIISCQFDSQESGVVAERPYLEVDYTEFVATERATERATRSSVALGISPSIGL